MVHADLRLGTMCMIQTLLGHKSNIVDVALSRRALKCYYTGSVTFGGGNIFFFMFLFAAKNLLKFDIEWLKIISPLHDLKSMRLDCILPEISPFINPKILGNSTLVMFPYNKVAICYIVWLPIAPIAKLPGFGMSSQKCTKLSIFFSGDFGFKLWSQCNAYPLYCAPQCNCVSIKYWSAQIFKMPVRG